MGSRYIFLKLWTINFNSTGDRFWEIELGHYIKHQRYGDRSLKHLMFNHGAIVLKTS